jgi:hypothetical protein
LKGDVSDLYLKISIQHSGRETYENDEEISVSVADKPAEIRTGYLSHTNSERYRYMKESHKEEAAPILKLDTRWG